MFQKISNEASFYLYNSELDSFFRLIGNFVSLSPEFCFVTEDDEGVFGYVMAAPDAKSLVSKCNETWVPAMKTKYPKPANQDLTSAEVVYTDY